MERCLGRLLGHVWEDVERCVDSDREGAWRLNKKNYKKHLKHAYIFIKTYTSPSAVVRNCGDEKSSTQKFKEASVKINVNM